MAGSRLDQAARPSHAVICSTPGLPSGLATCLEDEAVPFTLALIVRARRYDPSHTAAEPRRLGFGFVQVDPAADERLGVGFRDLPPARAVRLAVKADHVFVLAAFMTAEQVNSFCHVAAPYLRGYSPRMSNKLDVLLERLKTHQRMLILAMAEHDGLPAGNALRQVAELENVIAVVEAVAGEETKSVRKASLKA